VGCCNVVEHGRYGLSCTVCRNCAVHEQCWYVDFIAAEHGRCGSSFMCKTGVNKAEYLVHSMHMNRLSACREFCGVHSWQNGTRCRNGVKVLWYYFNLVWLVFEASIPTCACFLQKTFCDLFLLLFCLFVLCLGMVREERWEGRPTGRCMDNFLFT